VTLTDAQKKVIVAILMGVAAVLSAVNNEKEGD